MKTILVSIVALSLSGCFFVSKKPAKSSSSQPATASEPKNHGQERAAEVHERNEERKEDKDAMKDAQKASKGK
jgi:hypothetical protein